MPQFDENNYPAKVVIEITAEGYTTTVIDSQGEQIARRGAVMEGAGRARGTESGEFFDDLGEDCEELADELEGMLPFSIACELVSIKELFE